MSNPSDNENRNASYGGVNYPDATKLLRPQSLRGSSKLLVLVFMIAALAVGALCVYKIADGVYFSKIAEENAVTQNITRSSSYDFPQIKSYVTWSSDDLKNEIQNEYTTVQLAPDSDYPHGGFDIFKLPSDVDAKEGTAALANGIGKMDIQSASRVLNGGWRMTMDLSNYIDLKIRYTDFQSQQIEAAIQNAVQTQGFTGDAVELTGEGVDDSGNTYKAGTIEIDDETYFWRVSAVPFKDAYKIQGIPDSAIYVGVRITN